MKTKHYHASPYRHSPGDIIAGQSRNMEHYGLWVYMTTSPVPHYTIHEKALDENWFVYEVRPIGKVKFGSTWDEALAHSVEIVNRVGTARGIDKNQRFKIKPGRGNGSGVHSKRHKAWRAVLMNNDEIAKRYFGF